MPLPRQAQQQLEQANALLTPQPTPAPTAPPAAEPAPPEPTSAPVSTAATPPAPAPATPAGPENWEHKYKVLQGMFNQLNDRFKDAVKRLENISVQPPAPTPAPTEPPRPAADPKDVEAFGLDMVAMVQRTAEQFMAGAQQAIEARFAQIDAGINELRQIVQGTTRTVAASAEDAFFEKLTQLVPQWQEINKQDAFLAFLADADPVYGVPRQAALDAAQAKWDAHRAANVFKAFIATLPQPPAAPPLESPEPRGAGTPPPPPASQKPVYSQASITAFYDDVRRGRYRGRDAERLAFEAEINAALQEGRVR